MKIKTLTKHCVFLLSFLLIASSCSHKQKQEIANKANSDEQSFSFAFMTDIHLQPERKAVEGFKQAISDVNKRKPDFVITGGDLIMDALGQTYERSDSLYKLYNGTADLFKMPVYNTLGNHEIFGIYEESGVDRNHPEFDEKMYENRVGKRYYSFNHTGWHFIILDSVDESDKGGGYYGHVDKEQLEWLKKDLASVDPETPIVISVHIPFITVFHLIREGSQAKAGDGLVITNAKEVLDLFEEHNLKLALQGHLHVLEDLYYQGVHYITGGAVSGRWWSGTRDGMEEGYLMVHVTGDDLEWEYVDYGWEAVGE
ncbi:MAG: metallophosphoesterase [Bacteroidales bacterium]|nr:metallophosphoesterase [Bacteroidales bacterium]